MNIKLLVGAAALALSVPPAITLAPAAGSNVPITITNLAQNPFGWPRPTNQLGGTRLIFNVAAEPLSGKFKTGKQTATTKLSSLLPTPGVYRTEPYACIAVVPGTNADDRCLVRPGESDPAMLAIKPELRFIPLNSK